MIPSQYVLRTPGQRLWVMFRTDFIVLVRNSDIFSKLLSRSRMGVFRVYVKVRGSHVVALLIGSGPETQDLS